LSETPETREKLRLKTIATN